MPPIEPKQSAKGSTASGKALPSDKSAAGAPGKGSSAEVLQACELLEAELASLRSAYDQYFLGVDRHPPSRKHEDLKRHLTQLKGSFVRGTAAKFRVNALHSKFLTYERLWQRTLLEIENGTYKRDLLKLERRSKRAGGAEADKEKQKQGPVELNEEDVPESFDDLEAELEQAAVALDRRAPPPSFKEPAAVPPVAPSVPVVAPLTPAIAPVVPQRTQSSLGTPVVPPVRTTTGPIPVVPPVVPPPPPGARTVTSGSIPMVPPVVPPPPPGARTVTSGGIPLIPPARTTTGSIPVVPPVAPPPPPGARTVTSGGVPAVPPARTTTGSNVPAAGARPPAPPPAARAAPAPVASGGGDVSDDKLRAVYDAYVSAKRRNKEDTSKMSYESVAASLRKQVPELLKQHNARSVEFKVVIKDGKAVLKAVPK
jgi:hypothetical protein